MSKKLRGISIGILFANFDSNIKAIIKDRSLRWPSSFFRIEEFIME